MPTGTVDALERGDRGGEPLGERDAPGVHADEHDVGRRRDCARRSRARCGSAPGAGRRRRTRWCAARRRQPDRRSGPGRETTLATRARVVSRRQLSPRARARASVRPPWRPHGIPFTVRARIAPRRRPRARMATCPSTENPSASSVSPTVADAFVVQVHGQRRRVLARRLRRRAGAPGPAADALQPRERRAPPSSRAGAPTPARSRASSSGAPSASEHEHAPRAARARARGDARPASHEPLVGRVAGERDRRGGIERLPADAGEVDLGPRVRVALAHDELAGERVAVPGHEAGREPRRDPDAARHHHEAARDLLAPADARAEQEVVDDVDALRRERRVERVPHVRAEPRFDRAGSCRRSSARDAVICARERAAPGRSSTRRLRELVDAPRRAPACGSAARSSAAVGEHAPARDRVGRALAEAAVDRRGPVGVTLDDLVGLDRDRARRREHDVREAGLDVERLAHRPAVERADVVGIGRDRRRRCRSRASGVGRGSDCVHVVPVPLVEGLAPPERRRAARRP